MTKLTQDQIELVVQMLIMDEQELITNILGSPIHKEKGINVKNKLLHYMKQDIPIKSFIDGYIKEAALMELCVATYITNVLHKIHNIMKSGIVPYDLDSAEYIIESMADARIRAYKDRILSCTRAVVKGIKRDGGLS